MPRHARRENPGPGARAVAGPADGRAAAGERDSRSARSAEERPEKRQGPDRGHPPLPARLRRDGEGLRHAHGRSQVRARKGCALFEPVPDQPVEDRRRPLRSSARRARRPAPPLTEPKLFVVTGPSGAGKGTLIDALLERRSDLELAVSATTRARRPGEADGRDYHFLSDEEFDRRVAGDEFLEYVTFVNQRSGTLLSEIDRISAKGKACLL